MEWGVSFNNGLSLYTFLVLFKQEKLDVTFFIIGLSMYWLLTVVQAEYMARHQIAVHMWFHQHLTMLSKKEIISELGYTWEIIKDVIGVTPKYMRPPYGDIDDWVHTDPDGLSSHDTWPVRHKQLEDPWCALNQTILLQAVPEHPPEHENMIMLNTGFIMLEHNLYQQTVDLAVGYTIPYAQQHQPPFSLKSINKAPGDSARNAQLLRLALQPQSYLSSKPLVSHQLMLLLLQLGWSVSASATIRYGEGWREKGIVRVDR
ncbi:carbohydrate esterase family 4 protein [Ramaria rubella]|nr:carbohydrate esterase family 4 protein [Ramaria rubella]